MAVACFADESSEEPSLCFVVLTDVSMAVDEVEFDACREFPRFVALLVLYVVVESDRPPLVDGVA